MRALYVLIISTIAILTTSFSANASISQCSMLLNPSPGLTNFEALQINEITADSALNNLSPGGVVDFVKTYFTHLPEGLLLGAKDFRYNFLNENHIRPEFFLMNQRKAAKARLWRNHFGFFIHSSFAIGYPYFFSTELHPGFLAAVVGTNGLSSIKILVTTGALQRKHRLYQVLEYIK